MQGNFWDNKKSSKAVIPKSTETSQVGLRSIFYEKILTILHDRKVFRFFAEVLIVENMGLESDFDCVLFDLFN